MRSNHIMRNKMMSHNLNQNGYTSCIKVFGVPILPPLITEERRKELYDDKQKAIETEKKLKGKRSSIDSGVMTGSYIEHFRNNETNQNDVSCPKQLSIPDLTLKRNIQNTVGSSSNDVVDNVVSDSYLKTALEDPEFREFFSNTAERIFKDNKIENILNLPAEDNLHTFELRYETSDINAPDLFSDSSSYVAQEPFVISFSNSLSQVPRITESDLSLKCLEDKVDDGNGATCHEKHMKDLSSPPPPRIRRNSYTLESPSPVLLEHLAKEIGSGGKKEPGKWQSLSAKKDKAKGPGFKTFTGRSQRKHWNKKVCLASPHVRVENNRTKFTFGRSNTFVKSKTEEGNFSLPCSSRTSPLQFFSFTRSVDCLKSMSTNPLYGLRKEETGNFRESNECGNKVSIPEISMNNVSSESETYIVEKDNELHSASAEISPISLNNNPSSGIQSNCSTNNSSPQQIELSDSASQLSNVTHPTYIQLNSAGSRNVDVGKLNMNSFEDIDDIVSLCSSMSISRFLPTNDVSRPSTAEEVSVANIRQLKMKHENELRELLEKQRKEEEIISQIISNRSLSSTTNLSNCDIFDTKSELLFVENSRESCSRELFPKIKTGRIDNSRRDACSEREEKAATKLTAHVKGYLTRRLLKTEKVQQLIELIKESLTCAFSLQLEPQLKQNDLELHARLAHQLTTALSELQNIVSAPAATRMAIIAADREKLRRPVSRPSSTISAATRRSILRRQQSLNSSEKKRHESRVRTKSFSVSGSIGSVASGSHVRSDSPSTISTTSSRKPWR